MDLVGVDGEGDGVADRGFLPGRDADRELFLRAGVSGLVP